MPTHDAHEPAHFERLEALYGAALELPPEARAAFLDSSCGDDPVLRRELEELLAAAPGAERFFERFAEVVRAASVDPAAPPPDPLIGSTFGRYRIEARLGAGGMGVVYRAQDARLQRAVALKVLAPHLASEPDARRRFLTEARAAASLDHPNICTVYETGEAESGVPYIAMAYCEGETLRARVARGRVPPADAVGLALGMARGLAAAHGRGVVHRDVKPANVMIGPDGLVKLVDFGLARLVDTTLTAPALARGTFAYMAPELLRGQGADARSDLWSLGVVLYEMLTGTRPFRADSDAALLYAIAHQRPEPIGEVQKDVPAALAEVIHRLLQDDPALRYPSARDVARDLERLAGVSPTPTPVPGPMGRLQEEERARVRAPKRWLIPTVVAAGVVAASLFAMRGDTRGVRPPAPPLPAPRVAVLFFEDDPDEDVPANVSDDVTVALINALVEVPGLNVPSVVFVRPYRGSGLPPSAIADSLGAEWLVGGLTTRRGGVFALTAELSDSTGRLVDSHRVEHADPQLLVDDAVLAVASMVREAIGDAQRERHWQRGTTSELALRLMQQAAQEVENANALSGRTQPSRAVGVLLRADSLLARAAEADSEWAEPLIERARLARQLASTAFGINEFRPDSAVAQALRRGISHASDALRLGPDEAGAYEARGLLYDASMVLLGAVTDSVTVTSWHALAERDLRAAVERDPSLPRALDALATLQDSRGEFEEARLMLEQAYRADYYEESSQILKRLFEVTFETQDDSAAADWCARIRRRFPDDWFGAHCRLRLMTWGAGERADADSAWLLVRRGEAASAPIQRAAVASQLEVLAAGAIGLAVPGDSAVRVLDRTLARVTADPVLARDVNNGLVLLRLHASVRARLGDRERAIQLLEEYLRQLPSERTRLSHTREFGSLFDDPRLRASSR
jgi:tetratricopeptide (TPR) repeat protein